MEAVGEGDDVVAPLDVAGELHRRFDRIGAGRAGELGDVFETARREYVRVEGVEKRLLGGRMHVEAVGDAATRDVFDEPGAQVGVVVAVIQAAGAGKEVDVALAAFIVEVRPSAVLNTTGNERA